MYALDLAQIIELRIFNGVFMITGIIFLMKKLTEQFSGEVNYLQAMSYGILMTAVSVVLFAIFILFFLLSNPGFMNLLVETAIFGRYLNPYILSAVIALEGTISGMMLTFMALQYFKKGLMLESQV
jgi:hypothetical protein